MQKVVSKLLIIFLLSGSGLGVLASSNTDACKSILNWIYRELTLTNLDASYERLTDKLLLGLYKVNQNSAQNYLYDEEMTELFNSLKTIDPELESYISNNSTVMITSYFSDRNLNTASSFQKVAKSWKKLQSTSPHLFIGLDDQYKLDDWDMMTVDLLDEVSNFEFKNSDLKEKLQDLSQSLEESQIKVLAGKNFNEEELKGNIRSTHNDLINSFNNNYNDVLNEYGNICSQAELKLVMEGNNLVCPTSAKDSTLSEMNSKLLEISKIISTGVDLNMKAPEAQKKFIEIEKLDYKVSTSKKSTFCKRDESLASMIVVHHTGTKNTLTPYQINNMHLDNGGTSDPWYMMGYNYIVSDSFQGATTQKPKVFEGRPPGHRGAHAGGYTPPLSTEEKEFYKDKKIRCGNPIIGFPEEPALMNQLNSKGGISGNLASFGVAVIGNYSSKSYKWNGVAYVPKNIHARAKEPQIPDSKMVESVAKLACQIQKQHKRVRKIVPHSNFKPTDCPGTVINFLSQVTERANSLGCNFELEIKHYYK